MLIGSWLVGFLIDGLRIYGIKETLNLSNWPAYFCDQPAWKVDRIILKTALIGLWKRCNSSGAFLFLRFWFSSWIPFRVSGLYEWL
jgi:hypothetical protein